MTLEDYFEIQDTAGEMMRKLEDAGVPTNPDSSWKGAASVYSHTQYFKEVIRASFKLYEDDLSSAIIPPHYPSLGWSGEPK